ncbi:MAG: radical SAM protein [Bacteroidetes bacterium]|nr:radical SAM protein [Bacteroidota bacterium]
MPKTDILLITPPFIQLNTAYPATACLKAYLQNKGFKAAQLDLSILCILELLSSKGLQSIFETAETNKCTANAKKIFSQKDEYIRHIEAVIAFLQGKDSSFAYSVNNGILPKAGRFNIQQDLEWHFGTDSVNDKARFLATLFIEDIGDFITECVDHRFGFSRYAEQIGLEAINYQTIVDELKADTLISTIMCKLLNNAIQEFQPKVIGFTIPFPGNLLMALKSAEFIRKNYPQIKIVIGGGFVSTELRELNEPKLFDLVDFVCLDDGELCLELVLEHIINANPELARTFTLENGNVVYNNNTKRKDIAHKDCGTPDFEGLPLQDYISVTETTNPMHNLWSNGRWNKMALAHGCYWHRCSFCDVSLDYIKRYSAADAGILCDRIEAIIKQTAHHGFHFVDEAASPVLLRKLAEEILHRKLSLSWWTNIRFESGFTAELCELLAKSGCIAVSGGLEVASDRLLDKMEKGVSIEQVSKVTASFQQAGIMIHAYLMYGFPTQTAQETIDSLEIVRQLFSLKLLQSAFWHRFAMTIHSPVGMHPEKYGVERIPYPENVFAQNGCFHIDKTGCDHEKFGAGLNKALYNYMHDNGLENNFKDWFDFKVPQTQIPPNYIFKIIRKKNRKN